MPGKASNQDFDLSSLIPKEIMGWKAEEKDRLFNPDTIFDYIDGAGEVYRSYNFKHLLARRLTRAGKPALVADLFDMGSAKDAFGVFSHDLEGEDRRIGQGSNYKGGLLSFWKNRFFVSVYAEEETEETRKAVFELGKDIEAAIGVEGKMPDIISWLPDEGLVADKVRFFHTHLILNYHFFVSDQNIFLLDAETDAVLAPYKDEAGKAQYRLLLISYPDADKAKEAHKSYTEAYMPDARGAGVIQTEDGKWTMAVSKGTLLGVVFQAPSESSAKGLLSRIGDPKKSIE